MQTRSRYVMTDSAARRARARWRYFIVAPYGSLLQRCRPPATRSGGVALAARRTSRLLNQFQYLPVTREATEPVQVPVHFGPRPGLVVGVGPQAVPQGAGRDEVPRPSGQA